MKPEIRFLPDSKEQLAQTTNRHMRQIAEAIKKRLAILKGKK